jgi:hypothetical protein
LQFVNDFRQNFHLVRVVAGGACLGYDGSKVATAHGLRFRPVCERWQLGLLGRFHRGKSLAMAAAASASRTARLSKLCVASLGIFERQTFHAL